MPDKMKDADKIFKEFWVPIIFDMKSGRLNLEQLKKELYDYAMLLDNVPKVYSEITSGKISKPNTCAEVVIAEYHDVLSELVQEATKDAKDA